MTINLRKSNSDKFLLVFLLGDGISDVYFSLVLCSTIHNGVQIVLGLYQEGKPFTLVEMGIHDQYT